MSALSTRVRISATRALAPAKINLALGVTGQRPDGYHTLSSLVAFAEDGDRLSVAPAEADSLTISGPLREALADCAADDNIIAKALRLARRIAADAGYELGPLALSLDKHLPVASGIGGGSADAAALLRILADAVPEVGAELRRAALGLGADVPMCIDCVPALVEGLGELGTAMARFPSVPCVLVNPSVRVGTPDVFRRLTNRVNPPLPPIPSRGFEDLDALVSYLSETRNDLEVSALSIAPEIRTVRAAVIDAGAVFARMSGSGATVFGLFGSQKAAKEAARAILLRQPDWWVMATRLAAAPNGIGGR